MKSVVFLVLIFGLLLMPVQAHAQAFTARSALGTPPFPTNIEFVAN